MALKPPVEVPQGAIRLNTDSQKLEFFAQDQWWEMATDAVNLDGNSRGLFTGGYRLSPNATRSDNTIQYVTIASTGNSVDFGDLTTDRSATGNFGSATRGVNLGGYVAPTDINTIDYVTIMSTGNTVDFGDTTVIVRYPCSVNNATRGVITGGISTPTVGINVMAYNTIATTGNSQDFGDLTKATYSQRNGMSSSTRGVLPYGLSGTNNIDYITFSTVGNAINFGDAAVGTSAAYGHGQMSTGTRGVFNGGDSQNTIQYITISTQGNSVEFGDTTANQGGCAALSSTSRAIIAIGNPASPYNNNTLDYITMTSAGNAVDFGDLVTVAGYSGALSNAHGGL